MQRLPLTRLRRAAPLAVAVFTCVAQSTVPDVLGLDSIFVEGAFANERFGPARSLDGSSYATVEPAAGPSGGDDLVRYDAATGTRSVIVAATRLVPQFRRGEPLPIEDYALSPDGTQLLLFTNSRRVWRANTRGDDWLLELASGRLRKIGGTAREAALMFAKFSPDGTRVAYVRDNDIYMEDLRTEVVTRLTHDGSDTVVNGTFDWVYEEELFLRDGFRWSPDGRHIAFWQLDGSLVKDYVLVNTTAQLYPVLTRFPYPKAGETNPAARLGVMPAGGGEVRWIGLPGSPRDNYIARMSWTARPNELVIQYLNRRQNVNRVYLADIRSGRPRHVLRETDEAWVEIVDDLAWLDSGRAFTWTSERDGWRRAYRVSRDGGAIEPLTPAHTDVLSIDLVDEAGGWLYFTATPDPTRRFLYRVPLQPDPTRVEMISPLRTGGTHAYQLAPGAAFAIHTWSAFDTPPSIDLVSLPDHTALRSLRDNAELHRTFAALGQPPTEFFRIEVEPGVELDAWLMRPTDFDPEHKYPVLFFVYGEPWGQTVLDRWGGDRALWHRYLTRRLGYAVMSVDNRGTPAPRGRDWRKIVYGEVGTLAAADQAAAVRRIAQEHPWVDTDRVGIWGWSGGGSMTLNALFRYPEI